MNQNLLSIGELSGLTDIHIKSLRYYERIGILKPEYVNPESGYRYYSYQQVTLVMAIHLCVTLGIPLKEFQKYSDGERLRYGDLVRDGRALARQKFSELQKGLAHLDMAMEEIELAQTHPPRTVYRRALKERFVLLHKLSGAHKAPYYTNLGELFRKAEESGLDTGYEVGYYCDDMEGTRNSYSFLEVHPGEVAHPEVIRFPAGTYTCMLGDSLSLRDAPALFEDVYRSSKRVCVIETEIFTRESSIDAPQIELRVIGLPSTPA